MLFSFIAAGLSSTAVRIPDSTIAGRSESVSGGDTTCM